MSVEGFPCFGGIGGVGFSGLRPGSKDLMLEVLARGLEALSPAKAGKRRLASSTANPKLCTLKQIDHKHVDIDDAIRQWHEEE